MPSVTWTIPAAAIAHDGDAEVVARVLAGDTEGFRTLVERHEVSVLRIVRNLAPRSSSPEDIAQDVFVSAFVALATFDGRRGRFSSWLFAIARNRSLNARKRMSPRLLEEPEALPDARAPDDACSNAEIRRRLDDALEALPAPQRTCFVLEERNADTQYRIALAPSEGPRSPSTLAAVTVPSGHCFLLGDNRRQSVDSRAIGPVPLTDIVGRVWRPW